MWTVVTVAVIGVMVALVSLGQRQLLYVPDTTNVGTVADRVPGAQDVILTTDDGLDLHAWLLPPTGPDRDTAVLYCPGNGGNRLGRLEVGLAIAAEGFTVLLLEYRGYGANPGSPSEDGLARDARAAAAHLREAGFAPERTVYVGESIGTGVCVGLSVTDPSAAMLLRSPFTSMVDVVQGRVPFLPMGLLLQDRFPSAERLAESDVPVMVLHGDADDVVPSHLSAELASQVGNLHSEVVLPGVGHNDPVWFGPYLAAAVAELADATVGPNGSPSARARGPGPGGVIAPG